MSRWGKWVPKIDGNAAERVAGLALVSGGVAYWSLPAAAICLGVLFLAFDVLDWLLTWKAANAGRAE